LKVTLSYFVEPSPNWDASVSPQRYQSYGLRFDLKRILETEREFLQRINRFERDGSARRNAVADDGWTFGSQSVAAGSIHCDVWRGPATDLAARNKLAVYPIGGWWRDRTKLKRFDAKTRYALAVSITSEDEEVRLHSEVLQLISVANQISV